MRCKLKAARLAIPLWITLWITFLALPSLAASEAPCTIGAARAVILSFQQGAKPGDQVTLRLSVPPKTKCAIEAQGASLLDMEALRTKESDANGVVSWTWRVPNNYKAQSMPVIVTLNCNNQPEKLITELRVKTAAGPRLSIASATPLAGDGDAVEVTAQTVPNATCKIAVQDVSFIDAMALGDRKANSKGAVSWTFHVPKGYKADKIPVIITSEAGNAQSKAFAAIDVGQFTAARPGQFVH
jgi:hypothetical protein